jgi:hypothetical protein
MKWAWSRLKALLEVNYSPELVFGRNLDGPSYLIPLVVLSLFSVILAAIQSPIQLEWMRWQMDAAGAPASQAAAQLDLMRRSTKAGLVAVPLLYLFRWLAHALLIWLTAQLFLVQLKFSQMLTIVAYSYVPLVLRDAVICLILCLRDPEVIRGAEGLNVAVGLNLLFPRIPPPWWALAANFNLFEVWFVALLVVGISARAQTRWRRALAIVLPVWLFVTLIQLGFVSLGYQLKGQFARG